MSDFRIDNMKTQRVGSQLTVALEGPIGETTPMFTLPLGGVTEIILDLGGVTYINSIGVKQWILWTLKIPPACQVKLVDSPFVFASQASIVVGFLTQNMRIESVRLPYACEECGAEETYLAKRGTDFEYSTAEAPSHISIPKERPCPKCEAGKMEPDFFLEKTFKFLT